LRTRRLCRAAWPEFTGAPRFDVELDSPNYSFAFSSFLTVTFFLRRGLVLPKLPAKIFPRRVLLSPLPIIIHLVNFLSTFDHVDFPKTFFFIQFELQSRIEIARSVQNYICRCPAAVDFETGYFDICRPFFIKILRPDKVVGIELVSIIDSFIFIITTSRDKLLQLTWLLSQRKFVFRNFPNVPRVKTSDR
jgi:hypothetical protein